MVQDFKNIQVWQDSINFHKALISELAKFPKEEQYAMNSQLRRASLSISNNIAEGCGKSSKKEFRSYLLNAMGSCKEVESMLYMARELNYITELTFKKLNDDINIIGKKLNSFIQTLNQGIENS